MKFFLKALIGCIIITSLIGGFFFFLKKGSFDGIIKSSLETYLTKKGIINNIENFRIRGNTIFINKINLEINKNIRLEVRGIKLRIKFNNIIKKPGFFSEVDIANLSLKDENGNPIFYTSVKGESILNLYNKGITNKILLNKISSDIGENILTDLSLVEGECFNEGKLYGDNYFNCKIKIGDKSHFFINALLKNQNIKIESSFKEIPLIMYKLFENLSPGNKIFSFLNEYIKDGHINEGELSINLDEKFLKNKILTSDNLSGKFKLSNLQYIYNPQFPPIKNALIDIILSGSNTKFLLHQAYSGKTLITNGIITLDWTGIDPSTVKVNAQGKGLIVDFIEFIPFSSLENLKKNGINLREFKGNANTKIELEIPLNSKLKNKYNIYTISENANLKLFDNKIELDNAQIEGLFNGEQVIFKSVGKINNYPSKLLYTYNLVNSKEYVQLLKINTSITAQNQNFGLIQLLKGESIIDFEYKDTGKEAYIHSFSALNNLEFKIDKIAIYKPSKDKAYLEIDSILNKGAFDTFNIKLEGENNLKIIGKIKIEDNNFYINLPTLKHYETDVIVKATFNKHYTKAKLEGAQLDLSKADMTQFLVKNQEGSNIDLKVDLNKVILKENISLTNFKLNIQCDKVKCFDGILDSNIGTRSFKMTLKPHEDTEKWDFTSTNAGALLKGIGLYNNMRTGTMMLSLIAKRKLAKSGETIPILDGDFTFKNFAIVDNPFTTRLASFISLPGLKNLLTNNKDIIFKNMKGKFNYNNNIVNITESYAEGPFFDFSLAGIINAEKRKLELHGNVTPALYGISTVIKYFPVIGKAFSGGHRRGIIFSPYSIRQSY